MVMLHYLIKGNEVYNNLLANILHFTHTLDPGMGSKGVFFSEGRHGAYQINGNEA